MANAVGADAQMGTAVPLGISDDGPGRIGIALATRLTAGGKQLTVVSNNTLVLVQGHLLAVYMYLPDIGGPEVLNEISISSRRWVDAILEANR